MDSLTRLVELLVPREDDQFAQAAAVREAALREVEGGAEAFLRGA